MSFSAPTGAAGAAPGRGTGVHSMLRREALVSLALAFAALPRPAASAVTAATLAVEGECARLTITLPPTRRA